MWERPMAATEPAPTLVAGMARSHGKAARQST